MTKRILRTLQNLCLNEFKMNLYSYDEHYYSTHNTSGTFWSSFILILKGQMTIKSSTFTYIINPGELFFIPANSRYEEYSSSNEQLTFYSIVFSFKEAEGRSFDEKYGITKINSFPEKLIIKRFDTIFDQFGKDESNQLLALSDFYSLFSEVLPILKEIKPTSLHPVIQKAMDYINEHLFDNYTIKDIAKHCHISESRLYHLFNSELKTTPITYKNDMKVKASFTLLTTTDLSVKEIADKMNFASVTHYRYAFRKTTNSTPNRYRKIFRLHHNNFKGY